jgi:hypothetical protein
VEVHRAMHLGKDTQERATTMSFTAISPYVVASLLPGKTIVASSMPVNRGGSNPEWTDSHARSLQLKLFEGAKTIELQVRSRHDILCG